MEGLKLIPYLFLVLAVAGIVGGAAAVTLSTFGDTLTSKCYNASFTFDSTTADRCTNSTSNTSAAGQDLQVGTHAGTADHR